MAADQGRLCDRCDRCDILSAATTRPSRFCLSASDHGRLCDRCCDQILGNDETRALFLSFCAATMCEDHAFFVIEYSKFRRADLLHSNRQVSLRHSYRSMNWVSRLFYRSMNYMSSLLCIGKADADLLRSNQLVSCCHTCLAAV